MDDTIPVPSVSTQNALGIQSKGIMEKRSLYLFQHSRTGIDELTRDITKEIC